jgi:hypothetical protein
MRGAVVTLERGCAFRPVTGVTPVTRAVNIGRNEDRDPLPTCYDLLQNWLRVGPEIRDQIGNWCEEVANSTGGDVHWKTHLISSTRQRHWYDGSELRSEVVRGGEWAMFVEQEGRAKLKGPGSGNCKVMPPGASVAARLDWVSHFIKCDGRVYGREASTNSVADLSGARQYHSLEDVCCGGPRT